MLKVKSIGHAFALPKYPTLMAMVKAEDIGIELCPLSNAALGLCTDLRHHTVGILLRNNFPVVVASDDPAFWGALPLTHDMLATFLLIMSENQGIKAIKALIKNSIWKSSFNEHEKELAIEKWKEEWEKFIRKFIKFNN